MEINLYSVSIPPLLKALKAMDKLLEKAMEHAHSKGSERQPGEKHMEAMLNDRLVFDQFPLIRQIQFMSDNAKGAVGRLAAVEVPKYEDNEKTLEELKARIDKTIKFVETIKPEQIIGRDNEKVTLAFYPDKYMTAAEYVNEFLLPNFYFHFTTAYAIMRKNGVNIGKQDFLGGLPLKDL